MSEEPKTEAGVRVLPIPEDYSWIYKEIKKLRPFATFLCTNEKGERMTTNCLRMRFRKLCKILDFDCEKSPHELRRTYATILLDHGFDNSLIAYLMGHTNIKVTEDFYHIDRKTIQQKVQLINNIAEFKVS